MAASSYNETRNKQNSLRHILLPSGYGIISEVVIASTALIVFNITWLTNQLLSQQFDTVNPLSIWSQLLRDLLDAISKPYVVQQILLFCLWAIVGTLTYILVFRLWQIGSGVEHSVGTGLRYVQQDPRHGFYRWLASLHDFFIKVLVVATAISIMVIAVSICFSIASQELSIGLSTPFPGSLTAFLISILAAMLSVRLLVISFCLLSRRFRNWYVN